MWLSEWGGDPTFVTGLGLACHLPQAMNIHIYTSIYIIFQEITVITEAKANLQCTDRAGRSCGTAFHLYFGGARFEIRSGRRLSVLKFSWFFLVCPGKFQDFPLLDHDSFFPYLSNLSFIFTPKYWTIQLTVLKMSQNNQRKYRTVLFHDCLSLERKRPLLRPRSRWEWME
jgi:hypothetical protein